MRHRWDSPLEWLFYAIKTWDSGRVRQELLNLAEKLDSDTLQNEYQSEMAGDGYFTKHLEPSDVQVGLRVRVIRGCETGYDDEIGQICATVLRYSHVSALNLPVLVWFQEKEELEYFSYEELTYLTLAEDEIQVEVDLEVCADCGASTADPDQIHSCARIERTLQAAHMEELKKIFKRRD